MSSKFVGMVLVGAMGVAAPGCQNNTQTGALVGGLVGAGVGAGIGSVSHHRAGAGAAIGAGAGVIGGALVGAAMDKSEEDRAKEINRQDRAAYQANAAAGPGYVDYRGSQDYRYGSASGATYYGPQGTSYRESAAAPAAPAYAVQQPAISKVDVIAWAQQGTSDEVIIDRIERGNAVFHLTAADEMQLRQNRVSEDVIRAMRETARRGY